MEGKPIRLLATMATEDLNIEQAADRLHISVSTANQHLAKVRRAMGARTTMGALVVAVRRGLIRV